MNRNVFYGEYTHTLDEKGRVILPAKFREMLGEQCHITVGYDSCVTVYDDAGWDAFLGKLFDELEHETDEDYRRRIRIMASGGMDINIDKQGRMLIPPPLRARAKIDKEVSIVGNLNKIEIWPSEVWNGYLNDEANPLEKVSQKVEEKKNARV
ncbi:MAG: division/cell wall cluster transcriptional repressor MraZ [Clostridia bacterium]|nr:division/cell wall cluster transcriptional repressor MraZ [Clostridia bacterium]